MNKTIIINISGQVFHIEEGAYQALKTYIDSVKAHFSNYADKAEIVRDIEDRIAEMFAEQLSQASRQVLLQEDVSLMITRMGKPSDFEADENELFENENLNAINQPKKLYRDTEDRFIGGVCAGIAHYFNVAPKWIRILFIALFAFFGFGVLPYVLLWIVMPKAQTRSERLQMMGKKINLQSFAQSFEEELNAVASNLSQLKANTPAFGKTGLFIRNLVDGLMASIAKLLKFIVRIFGVLAMIFIGLLLCAAFICFTVFMGYISNTDMATIFPLNMITDSLRPLIFVCGFLLVIIPLFALFILLLRVLFNTKILNRNISFSLTALWILALATATFCIAKNATEFKEQASYTETINLKPNNKQSYVLRLGDERTVQEDVNNDEVDNRIIRISGSDRDFDSPRNLHFDLSIGGADAPILSKTYTARGSNFRNALKNAHLIVYYYHQSDSVLTFDKRFELSNAAAWRSQEVNLKLQIPVNATLYIEKKLADRFFYYQLDDCIEDDANDETLIAVTATKNGFLCRKTARAIAKEKERNLEENKDEEVSETVLF